MNTEELTVLSEKADKHDLRTYDEIISLLYDCATSEKGFKPFLEKSCEYLNATTGIIYVVDATTRHGRKGWAHGYPTGLLKILIKSGATKKDEGVTKAFNHEPGAIYSFSNGDDNYDISKELSVASKVWTKAMGMTDSATYTFSLEENERFLLVYNRCKNQGMFKQNDLDFLNILAPHIKRAVYINDVIYSQKLLNETLMRALNNLDHPMMLFSANGKLSNVNQEMEQLNEKYNLYGIKDDKVNFIDRELDSYFYTTLSTYVLQEGRQKRSKEVIFIPTCEEPVRLTFRSLFSKKHLSGVLIEAKDVNQVHITDYRIIKSIIDTTDSEAKVVEQLIHGSDIKKTADTLSLSEHTVRSYVKNVLAKNNCSKQVQLISKVIRAVI